ncbi:MAG TPA: hypothetical protein VE733_00315 [Streptosporangiaceae bacterium]|jgi:hypothetical protein|nr:hypothetical protein [Streptosporangiaceae bacterium]
MDKVYPSAAAAVADIGRGARLAVGGVRDRTAAPVIIPAEFTTATGAPAGGLS